MIGLGDDANAQAAVEWLRQTWCRDPAVHGGKQDLVDALAAADAAEHDGEEGANDDR